MATSKPMFSKPITPLAELVFEESILRATNTGLILSAAEHFGCHLIGLGQKDSRFPSSTNHKHLYLNFLYAEGKVDGWEVSWLIANRSKQGNKSGYNGCSPINHFDFHKGIYVFDGIDWHKSPPL